MTSPIEGIGSFGAYNPIAPVMTSGLSTSGVGTSGVGVTGAGQSLTAASNSTETSESGENFASLLADSLQNLQAVQTRKDELAVKAATGSLTDVHDYTIAATEASLATQLTVAVRDKAVAAFQEIMRMQ
ncbi:flagellar hook-basal body complex protein FliE [Cryptosporangium sp. NPDC048952]|uniref:flagellar hook-basal body complex protein FliE n=1 Tax=Cryptosporangium sp. NPDC048952 TaxID=3363961 RepID=UPI0037191C7A